jgi:hypothetical protein
MCIEATTATTYILIGVAVCMTYESAALSAESRQEYLCPCGTVAERHQIHSCSSGTVHYRTMRGCDTLNYQELESKVRLARLVPRDITKLIQRIQTRLFVLPPS